MLGDNDYYKQACAKNQDVKGLCDIPIHQDVLPRNGANEPDITVCNNNANGY